MVFEPFAFSGPSNTRSRGGIGLGLSITKRLVELHRGGIEIVSEVGRGTNVRISLSRRLAA
jgi:signal transduction histidine kinase